MPASPAHDLSGRQHSHVFDAGNRAGEVRTQIVIAVTALTMVVEIAVGWWSGSMALLADGWHMGTHVAALAIAVFAYRYARRWATDSRFAFGTWKVEVLGAFASAIVLGLVGVAVAVESLVRLARPEPIDFKIALIVAVVGLVVNLVCAFILEGAGGHSHAGHDHDHRHDHGHAHDLNLRAAYVHVLTDAFTSVLAIVALTAGLFLGWSWLDPAMGLVGAAVIAVWAWGLMRDSARVLLDREMDSPLVGQVRSALESDGDAQVADLHVWRVGRDRYACIACVVADAPLAPDVYRARLEALPTIAHATIEVNACPAKSCCGK
ncbi:Cadmium, cobalt and zinc/H(+)-K(+) antiporter [Usitatibacter rugosus]|uniref:Cadmium, cobalt and zinc/H(+)-K(+) antiporter n=1 Tax=Usitatibacter rugosus TaxID=2732067 RepID=A0A6M4GX37_9PROT|nr:CDF family Co(II)/Ni(II) efflux transporter DmeF [Usitatibacter rugosus]QJR11851.1 Cadmium, cobalt and zinc/H(+)-K(+) antiporter [Usitatibacter rugosus]